MICVICEKELEQSEIKYCSRMCKMDQIRRLLSKPKLFQEDISSLL